LRFDYFALSAPEMFVEIRAIRTPRLSVVTMLPHRNVIAQLAFPDATLGTFNILHHDFLHSLTEHGYG